MIFRNDKEGFNAVGFITLDTINPLALEMDI